MPVVEFTHSEKGWFLDKQMQTSNLIAEAEAAVVAAQRNVEQMKQNGQLMIGRLLGDIAKSHNLPPPPNADLVYTDKGQAIGLIWGKEKAEFYAGNVKIFGAVIPPQPSAPPKTPSDKNGAQAPASPSPTPSPKKMKKARLVKVNHNKDDPSPAREGNEGSKKAT